LPSRPVWWLCVSMRLFYCMRWFYFYCGGDWERRERERERCVIFFFGYGK
jgi:hypothetical protein